MDTYSIFRTSVLTTVVLLFLSACGGSGGGGGGNNEKGAIDTTAPVIFITTPSADPSYTTSNRTISISGTATDDVGITEVDWCQH